MGARRSHKERRAAPPDLLVAITRYPRSGRPGPPPPQEPHPLRRPPLAQQRHNPLTGGRSLGGTAERPCCQRGRWGHDLAECSSAARSCTRCGRGRYKGCPAKSTPIGPRGAAQERMSTALLERSHVTEPRNWGRLAMSWLACYVADEWLYAFCSGRSVRPAATA